MRGAILLSVVLVVCGLVRLSEGITCTSLTLFTCKKSLLMTGRCIDGTCQCVSSDYTPGPFGCQTKPKSEITTDFNGDIQTGGSATLFCTNTLSTCQWFKDGVQLEERSKELDLNYVTTDMNGAYTCVSDPAGISSYESEPFHLNVVDSFTTKLEVLGMPTIVVPGTTIELRCVTHERYADNTFEWILDGKHLPGQTWNYYGHTVTKEDAGKTIRCSLPNAVASDQIVFPTNFATDIDRVEIQTSGSTTMLVDTSLDLRCQQMGGFPQPFFTDELIRYVWKKDGIILDFETFSSLHIYANRATIGSYTCEATAGSNPTKVSPPLSISVKITMSEKPLMSSSYGHVKNGYFSFRCNYDIVNTSMPVTYSWFKGWVELKGFTDNILQVNGATNNVIFDGLYSCKVTSQDGTVESWKEGVWLQPLSEIANDALTFKAPPKLGVGLPLALQCTPYLFTTPGMVYTWTVGTTRQEGQISDIFVYTPTSGDRVRIKCEYSFDGVTSQKRVSTIKPKYIYSVVVRSNDLNVTALQPVSGTTVKLMCDVSKSEGVGPVTYQWKKLSSVLPGETSQYFEAKVGRAGSAPLMISCLATVESVTVKSRTITVAPQTYAATPYVSMESDYDYKRQGEVVMACLSKSHAEGATYDWFKDGSVVIKGLTSYKYTIDQVAQTDEGDYSCRIIVGGRTSNASAVAKLKTLPNQLDCTWASECRQPNMDSSVCYHGNCRCSSGFTMKGGKCSATGWINGVYPKPSARRGHLSSLVFRSDVANELHVRSNHINMAIEDSDDPSL